MQNEYGRSGRIGGKFSSSGGGGVPLITKLYDQLGALLLEGISGVLTGTAAVQLKIKSLFTMLIESVGNMDITSGNYLNLTAVEDIYINGSGLTLDVVDYFTGTLGESFDIGSVHSTHLYSGDQFLSLESQTSYITLIANNEIRIEAGSIKTGATQVLAGAAQYELWQTIGHASLPDGVIMRGL